MGQDGHATGGATVVRADIHEVTLGRIEHRNTILLEKKNETSLPTLHDPHVGHGVIGAGTDVLCTLDLYAATEFVHNSSITKHLPFGEVRLVRE